MELNSAHLHLMFNHIPVLATLFSIPLLVWGILADQKIATKIALVGFILAGLSTILVVESGQRAEEIVESLPGVSEQIIEDHEHMAETTQWISIALGAISIFYFFAMERPINYKKLLVVALLVASLISGAMMAYTAYLGGKIMHPELSGDPPPSQQPGIELEN